MGIAPTCDRISGAENKHFPQLFNWIGIRLRVMFFEFTYRKLEFLVKSLISAYENLWQPDRKMKSWDNRLGVLLSSSPSPELFESIIIGPLMQGFRLHWTRWVRSKWTPPQMGVACVATQATSVPREQSSTLFVVTEHRRPKIFEASLGFPFDPKDSQIHRFIVDRGVKFIHFHHLHSRKKRQKPAK